MGVLGGEEVGYRENHSIQGGKIFNTPSKCCRGQAKEKPKEEIKATKEFRN